MFKGRRYTIGLVLLGVTLITVALVVRQLVFGGNMTTLSEPVSQQFSTSDAPLIVVETFDGAIEIRTGNTDVVSVIVVRKGSGLTESAAFDALSKVQVRMTQEGDTVRVRAWREEGGSKLSNTGASVEVIAPPGSEVHATSSNGNVLSVGIVGVIDARTSNGSIVLSGVHRPFAAATSNGKIEVSADAEVRAHAETSNGSIAFTGALTTGYFVTSNGSIRLNLPADAAFSIDAVTTNGAITCEFPLTGGIQNKTRLLGDSSTGHLAWIKAETSNGKIEIRRK